MTISVVLDVDKDDPQFAAFQSMGEQMLLGGRTVLRLSCKEVDFSGSILRLVLNQPQTLRGLTVWVRSDLMIFAYSGPVKKVGF